MRLGLIGIGIGQSAAPRLHRLAGGHYRIDIDYPLFDLADGGDFDDCLGACADRRGVNVTHPFKTRAIELVETVAPEIAERDGQPRQRAPLEDVVLNWAQL